MSLTQIIEKVNKVKGHFRDDQMTFLYPFVKRLNPKGLLVEIGTYRGKSAKFYSLANPEIKILTIDLVFFKHPRHESEGVYIDEKVLKNGNIFQVKGDSPEIAKRFNWKIDFLFIDGDHKYSVVKKDITGWAPHVKVGGYIAFHDYYPTHSAGQGREVADAVDDWVKDNTEFVKVTHSCNIYIAKKSIE